MDEPIYEGDESVADDGHELPERSVWVGALPPDEIPDEFPTIYFDFGVAQVLQSEGQRSIATDKEVAGILLGTRSDDNSTINVSHIAIARDDDSSPVHFKFTFSVWDDLIDQMDHLSSESGKDLLLLGWYHTHPNMAVFLSRYDLRTHRDFSRPYQFALVLAPRQGTPNTSVGFFVNRGEGVPLLPGLSMYGAESPEAIAAALPWQFQVVEAEGVYEGEAKEDPNSSRLVPIPSDPPVLQQLGRVQMEDPDWLTLGIDKAEGAVLPILEGMAVSVVETRADRVGVLLGSATEDNHITITRVRFLGPMSEDLDHEREAILGALRFMAETFPAHKDPRILGVVRIVSPHRFQPGDRFDPNEHNVRVALLLSEVGYDLDQVPFQVGLVLYPGIEEDAVFMHVFAQPKAARPVPLTSMKVWAPEQFKAPERYDFLDQEVFEVEELPCMQPPTLPQPEPPAEPPPRPTAPVSRKELVQTEDWAAASAEAIRVPEPGPTPLGPQSSQPGGGSGIDWDKVDEDDDAGSPAHFPKGLFLLLVLLLAAVGFLLFRSGGTTPEPTPAPSTDEPTPTAPASDSSLEMGQPYRFSLTGCGPDWNPTRACEPFAHEADASSVPLLTLERLPAYAARTIEPVEVWLQREEREVMLERVAQDNGYAFIVERGVAAWDALWAAPGDDTDEISARLVILPRGVPRDGEHELADLRRTQDLRLIVPPLPVAAAPSQGSHSSWTFDNGSAQQQADYDLKRSAFLEDLVVSGGKPEPGTWTLQLGPQGARPLVTRTVELGPDGGGRVDFKPSFTALMKSAEVVSALQGDHELTALEIRAAIPGGGQVLVNVTLKGTLEARPVDHKICVMMKNLDGATVPGKIILPHTGETRPTFSADEGGECLDGGATARWVKTTFEPGARKLQFVYLGKGPVSGKTQTTTIPASLVAAGAQSKCLAITLTVNNVGLQARAPDARAAYNLVDGDCVP